MKRLKYLFFLPVSAVLISVSCNKTNSDAAEQSGNWVSRSEFNGNARSAAAAFTIADTAYIATGYDGTYRYNDLWAYSVDNNAWVQKASIPLTPNSGVPGANGRSNACTFTVGANGYVVGGQENITSTNLLGRLKDTWQYNAPTNTWSQKQNFPEPNDQNNNSNGRVDACGFGIGNYGYLTCGFNGSYQKDMWQFDPVANTWTLKNSLGGNKRTGAAVFINPDSSTAYIVGGLGTSGTPVHDFWEYYPSTGTWRQLRDIANTSTDTYDDDYTDIARAYGVGLVMKNSGVTKGYIAVGQISGSPTVKTWEYDFKTDLWVRKTPYESTRVSRSYANSFVVKGRGFVCLGTSGSLYLDNLDEWRPADAYNAND